MWGGHYERGLDEVMAELNESISIDHRLFRHDIRGSLAHAEMLTKAGILTKDEGQHIADGLKQIEKEIAAGKMAFKPELEDIHMHIESRLRELIGDVAGKLHTARSRNDQVATDFKLYIRDASDVIDAQLEQLINALIDKAEQHAGTIMPGFTHLQSAQPVTLGHHLLAYVEMFGRDRSRLNDASARLNECPLGVAALAGTSFPIDREMTAKALGFARPTANSLDTSADRDFALEFLSNASLIGLHLSRMAEELVIWSSKQFHFITLSESFTTGSSIMPQKRNPDGAELVRGKTGVLLGQFVNLFTIMKGLPLAYNRDTQEDKQPVFEAIDTLLQTLPVMAGMITDFEANESRMKEEAGRGYSTATDLADWLVSAHNVPFRDAHHIVGRVVKAAEEQNKELYELDVQTIKNIDARLTEEVLELFHVEHAIHTRNSFGGTAPERVKEAINQARKRFL